MYYINHKKAEREKEKLSEELIELHKRCIIDYLVTYKSAKKRTRNKFFKLYDLAIDTENIRNYFFRSIPLFVHCLVRNELDKIIDYTDKSEEPCRKKRKKSKTRK